MREGGLRNFSVMENQRKREKEREKEAGRMCLEIGRETK